MKHYSASLEENNVLEAGGQLLVTDARMATGSAAAATVDGFLISAGDHTHILDAEGSEFDPKEDANDILAFAKDLNLSITHGSASGAGEFFLDLYLSGSNTGAEPSSDHTNADYGLRLDVANLIPVRSGRINGSNLELHSSAFADIHAANLLASIDVSSLFGGGGTGSAATNPTNNVLPVKLAHGTSNVFIDSIINEQRTGYFNVTGLSTADASGATITLTAASGLDVFTDGEAVIISHPGDGSANPAATFAATVTGAPTAGSVTVTPGTALTGYYSMQTTNFGLTDEGTVSGVVITGNVEIEGTTTTVDSTTVTLADQFIQLATPDGDVAARQSGFLTVAGSTSGTHNLQGIRYNTTDQAWEISSNTAGVAVDTNGIPTTDADWTRISTSTGTANKAVVNVAANTNLVTNSFDGATVTDTSGVTVRDDGTNTYRVTISIASGGNLPIANADVLVQVYDGLNMIIPDEITLNESAGSETVTVDLPVNFNPTTSLKIVIIG